MTLSVVTSHTYFRTNLGKQQRFHTLQYGVPRQIQRLWFSSTRSRAKSCWYLGTEIPAPSLISNRFVLFVIARLC